MAEPKVKDTVYSVYIISKDGSLLYQRDFESVMGRISSDTHLLVGSLFHAMHTVSMSPEIKPILTPGAVDAASDAAAARVAPNMVPFTISNGIQTVESSNFKLQCHQTQTGLKFILVTTPTYTGVETVMKQVVLQYTDYVMKNPFYSVGDPIRCHLFDTSLSQSVGTRH